MANAAAPGAPNGLDFGLDEYTLHIDPPTTDDFISNGSFGSVYRATLKATGEPIVCKVIRPNLGEANLTRAVRAYKLMLDLPPHPNITRVLKLCQNKTSTTDCSLVILMERAESTLFDEVRRRRLKPMAFLDIFIQVANGLNFLHTRLALPGTKKDVIIHLDLKPPNILLFPGGIAKLCDFDLMKPTETADSPLTHTQCTYQYAPPELLASALNPTIKVKAGASLDVYALGVMLLEYTSSVAPFASLGNNSSVEQWGAAKAAPPSVKFNPSLPEIFKDVQELGLRCVCHDHAQRPPLSEVAVYLESFRHCLKLAPKPPLTFVPLHRTDADPSSLLIAHNSTSDVVVIDPTGRTRPEMHWVNKPNWVCLHRVCAGFRKETPFFAVTENSTIYLFHALLGRLSTADENDNDNDEALVLEATFVADIDVSKMRLAAADKPPVGNGVCHLDADEKGNICVVFNAADAAFFFKLSPSDLSTPKDIVNLVEAGVRMATGFCFQSRFLCLATQGCIKLYDAKKKEVLVNLPLANNPAFSSLTMVDLIVFGIGNRQLKAANMETDDICDLCEKEKALVVTRYDAGTGRVLVEGTKKGEFRWAAFGKGGIVQDSEVRVSLGGSSFRPHGGALLPLVAPPQKKEKSKKK